MIIVSSRDCFPPREEAMKTEYSHPVAHITVLVIVFLTNLHGSVEVAVVRKHGFRREATSHGVRNHALPHASARSGAQRGGKCPHDIARGARH